MNQDNQFPWEIRDVDAKQAEELMKYYTGEHTGFVRVGPKGYFLPQQYRQQACNIYNMPLRDTDIFIVSYPRSGSTWMRELVWLVCNDLDYAKSEAVPLIRRYISPELSTFRHPKVLQELRNETMDPEKLKQIDYRSKPGVEMIANAISPRFLFSHLPLSLLPPNLLETAKIVYMARDPRDVAVSFYHLNRLLRVLHFTGDFKTFWTLFINDLCYWTPYFESIKEAWDKRHHPNILFLFYEDVSKDLPETIRLISAFFNKQFSEDQVAGLCEHLSIDNFRKNKSVNYHVTKEIGLLNSGEQPFIRKGKSGGWREYFDEEMTQQAQRWIADNLRDTNLRFPEHNLS